MQNHSSLMAEWCGQFSTKFYSKWSRFSHRSPKSTDFEEQTSRKYRKKGDVFFALVWSNKRINQHLGLPKRFAPGIRLHRKAEKSVHFLLRWLGTPSAKMKSIWGTHLTPISSTFLKYAFSGSLQPSERANWAGRPPRHNNFGRCGSIGGRMKGRGLPLSPLQGGGGTPLSGAEL